MAGRYDVELDTVIKIDVAPEDAILRQAAAGRHTLIVMGVNRRPGDTLFFGDVAAAVLEKSARSVLFISSARAAGDAQAAARNPSLVPVSK